jgi:hypothetical protein
VRQPTSIITVQWIFKKKNYGTTKKYHKYEDHIPTACLPKISPHSILPFMFSFLNVRVGNACKMLGRFSVGCTAQKLHVLSHVQICGSRQNFRGVGILNQNSQKMAVSADKILKITL